MNTKNISILVMVLLFAACSDNAIKLEPIKNESKSEITNSAVFGTEQNPSGHVHTDEESSQATLHKIKALEVLNTDRYVYIKAEEAGKIYWLATNKVKVVIGATYYFTGGYPQKNFPSKEFNRVFPELLLVNSIVGENHGTEPAPTKK